NAGVETVFAELSDDVGEILDDAKAARLQRNAAQDGRDEEDMRRAQAMRHAVERGMCLLGNELAARGERIQRGRRIDADGLAFQSLEPVRLLVLMPRQ